jgi:capsular exopolysaccharide synthesis family protein
MDAAPTLAREDAAADGVDVRYYADLLRRGWRLLLAALLSGLAVGLVVAFLQTPEYASRAMLQIEPPVPMFLGVTDALVGGGNYWQNADFYNTQYQVLRSRGLGEKVVERLGLQDREPFRGATDVGAAFMRHVTVEPVPESRLVRLAVVNPDPAEAARWASALTEVYIEQSAAGGVESARRAQQWLQERLAVTQQEMREAQDRLFKSYQSQDLFVPEGSQSAVTTSITRLNEEQVTAEARRIVLESALHQIEQMGERGQGLGSVPQVAADGLYQGLSGQLDALALERTRLLEKFKPGHPDVQKVDAQIAQLGKSRAERAEQIVRGLRAELAQLERREAETRGAIEAQKAQAAAQSRKGAELEALRKEAESAKNLYEVLLQKLNESNIAASMRSGNVVVVEKASVPTSPVRPDRKRIAALAALAGLLLGVALVLGRDYVDNTLKDAEEAERYLRLDVLASVPRHGPDRSGLVTEAYQNLRTALIFARRHDRGQVVLVTGTAPQEGKTTTVVNVARLLAASGERTLVVDCDLRRAQLHTWLGVPREPGLTDHFASHLDLAALVRKTSDKDLFALTAGTLPPNPPALLGRRDMAAILEGFRGEFEWVIVDSPPVASVTDALLLARHADTVLFVVQHNKVDKKLMKRAVSRLRRVTPNLLGAVFNAVDVKAAGAYSYYYPPYGETAADPSAVAAAPGGRRDPAA